MKGDDQICDQKQKSNSISSMLRRFYWLVFLPPKIQKLNILQVDENQIKPGLYKDQ